ncbi:MAG TPA: DUF6580 family putative transport protein [Chitinophagaceae bacterium]|nr:DUF6580 family putative transport protein [Chitinophagaceae bacterium]
MKSGKSLIWTMIVLIVVAALYRVIPGRPWGFAPQIAMALFGGAAIKDKKWAFALPIFSMFLSDLLYQGLYSAGFISDIYGFYPGQWVNYCLFALMVLVGMAIKRINVPSVLLASLAAPSLFFVLSNMATWSGLAGPRGLNRPFTIEGLLMALNDGLPFYKGAIAGTLFFSTLLFGGYYLLTKNNRQASIKAAHV